MLGETEEYRLLYAASSVEEAIQAARQSPPDVIVYDRASGTAEEADLTALLRLAPSELVELSLSKSDMTVFSRRQIGRATVENLLEVIQGVDTRRRTE